MKRMSFVLAAAVAFAASPAFAQLANLKVVTDASPDYSDLESMTQSITKNWPTDKEKMFAFFYWDHIARRQTSPMNLHGIDVTDPIRQFNDYGFTMCSTITGIKCSYWNYMGYPCRYWDIGLHTVPDVWYDGAFHHYDNSLSTYYVKPDGSIAAVNEVGRKGSGPETNGETVSGYLAKYHCEFGTSANGFLQGSDTERDLKHLGEDCYNPGVLKYRYYVYDQDRGHRYSLNLRDGEVYTRFYARQDAKSQNAIVQDPNQPGYKADPAYYVPNGSHGKDPEVVNVRYHIRGNGERAWTPLLDQAHLAQELSVADNITSTGKGIAPAAAGKPGVAIFKVEGANVICSLKIHALANLAAADGAAIAISTNNGLTWNDVWKSDKAGDVPVDLKLIKEVNASYEVLVKVNGKTQPQLKLGKNTVYVGYGEQTNTIHVWPELQNNKYKLSVVDEKNIACAKENPGYMGTLYQEKKGEAYVVFKVDAPTDITTITYGARMYNRAPKAHIDFLHSFDGGKTWKQSYSLTDTNAPWDVIHYERVTDIPAGTRSVLFKYLMDTPWEGATNNCSIYSVNMEVNHKLAAPTIAPVEVTFNWSERQKDYSTIKRSHTQVVDKFPATYTVNVGGYDQPIVDSLTVNLKGARPEVKPGYSDGKDVGGQKFVGVWATYGNNLAYKKPYTSSTPYVPKEQAWDAEDPDGTKLTDGVVGSSYTGGTAMARGAIWTKPTDITVDLGEAKKCAAFRIHMHGYEWWDAMKGEVKDKVELLTSTDGKNFVSQGNFDFNLHWKDIPVNYMYNDDETFCGHNFFLAPKAPVEARYVRYKVEPKRSLDITELQVLDGFKFEPFDLKLALPDPKDNGKAPPAPGLSPNAKKWKDGELPTTIGKEFIREVE